MSFSSQKLYNYVLGDYSNSEQKLEKIPEEKKEAHKSKKKKETKGFFSKIMAPAKLKQFRPALRKLGAIALEKILFDPSTDEKDERPYLVPNDAEINQKLLALNAEHGLFSKEELTPQAFAEYKKIFIISKLIGDFIENNNYSQNEEAYLHAFKIFVLFGGTKQGHLHQLDLYLRSNNFLNKPTPVHDALVHPFPKNAKIDLKRWQILTRMSPTAIELFSLAGPIEEALGGKAPASIKEAIEMAKQLRYKRWDENPELAQLCLTHHVVEEYFDECLEVKKNEKKHDNLPKLIINGDEVGSPGFVLIKLPLTDPRVFIMGKLTACCQSIDSEARNLVKQVVTSSEVANLVLLKKIGKTEQKLAPLAGPSDFETVNYSQYRIVGQGIIWRSYLGNLTIDSWENLHSKDDDKIVAMLQAYAKKAVKDDPSIVRMTIGTGGKTPAFYKKNPHTVTETMLEGEQYSDSLTQSVVYCDEARRNKNLKRLRKIFPWHEWGPLYWRHVLEILSYSSKLLDEKDSFFEDKRILSRFKELQKNKIRHENLGIACLTIIKLKNYLSDELFVFILNQAKKPYVEYNKWFVHSDKIPSLLELINASVALKNSKKLKNLILSTPIYNKEFIKSFSGLSDAKAAEEAFFKIRSKMTVREALFIFGSLREVGVENNIELIDQIMTSKDIFLANHQAIERFKALAEVKLTNDPGLNKIFITLDHEHFIYRVKRLRNMGYYNHPAVFKAILSDDFGSLGLSDFINKLDKIKQDIAITFDEEVLLIISFKKSSLIDKTLDNIPEIFKKISESKITNSTIVRQAMCKCHYYDMESILHLANSLDDANKENRDAFDQYLLQSEFYFPIIFQVFIKLEKMGLLGNKELFQFFLLKTKSPNWMKEMEKWAKKKYLDNMPKMVGMISKLPKVLRKNQEFIMFLFERAQYVDKLSEAFLGIEFDTRPDDFIKDILNTDQRSIDETIGTINYYKRNRFKNYRVTYSSHNQIFEEIENKSPSKMISQGHDDLYILLEKKGHPYNADVLRSPINTQKMGKWVIAFPENDPRIDLMWEHVSQGISDPHNTLIYSAKVSKQTDGHDIQAIIVYTPDFDDVENIYKIFNFLNTFLKKSIDGPPASFYYTKETDTIQEKETFLYTPLTIIERACPYLAELYQKIDKIGREDKKTEGPITIERPSSFANIIEFKNSLVDLFDLLGNEKENHGTRAQVVAAATTTMLINLENNTEQDETIKFEIIQEYARQCEKQVSGLSKLGRCLGCVVAAALGFVVGAVIGGAIGIAAGAWSGPGAAFTGTMGFFVGGCKGAALSVALSSTAAGIASAALCRNLLFRNDKLDQTVKRAVTCANTMKTTIG